MGWLGITIISLVFLVETALLWLAGHVIMRLYSNMQTFEFELEQRIDTALQILDNAHMEMTITANKPLLIDVPEIRAVVQAIKNSREAVVHVIKVLSDIEIEDNKGRAELPIIQNLTTEDPHDPKDLNELNQDVMAQFQREVAAGQRQLMIPQQKTLTSASQHAAVTAANQLRSHGRTPRGRS